MTGVLFLVPRYGLGFRSPSYAKFEPPERRSEPQIGPTSLKTLLHFTVSVSDGVQQVMIDTFLWASAIFFALLAQPTTKSIEQSLRPFQSNSRFEISTCSSRVISTILPRCCTPARERTSRASFRSGGNRPCGPDLRAIRSRPRPGVRWELFEKRR